MLDLHAHLQPAGHIINGHILLDADREVPLAHLPAQLADLATLARSRGLDTQALRRHAQKGKDGSIRDTVTLAISRDANIGPRIIVMVSIEADGRVTVEGTRHADFMRPVSGKAPSNTLILRRLADVLRATELPRRQPAAA